MERTTAAARVLIRAATGLQMLPGPYERQIFLLAGRGFQQIGYICKSIPTNKKLLKEKQKISEAALRPVLDH